MKSYTCAAALLERRQQALLHEIHYLRPGAGDYVTPQAAASRC